MLSSSLHSIPSSSSCILVLSVKLQCSIKVSGISIRVKAQNALRVRLMGQIQPANSFLFNQQHHARIITY